MRSHFIQWSTPFFFSLLERELQENEEQCGSHSGIEGSIKICFLQPVCDVEEKLIGIPMLTFSLEQG